MELSLFLRVHFFLLSAKDSLSCAHRTPAELQPKWDTHQRLPSTQGLQGTAHTSSVCPALSQDTTSIIPLGFSTEALQGHGMDSSSQHQPLVVLLWHSKYCFSLSLCCFQGYICPLTVFPFIPDPFPSGRGSC